MLMLGCSFFLCSPSSMKLDMSKASPKHINHEALAIIQTLLNLSVLEVQVHSYPPSIFCDVEKEFLPNVIQSSLPKLSCRSRWCLYFERIGVRSVSSSWQLLWEGTPPPKDHLLGNVRKKKAMSVNRFVEIADWCNFLVFVLRKQEQSQLQLVD